MTRQRIGAILTSTAIAIAIGAYAGSAAAGQHAARGGASAPMVVTPPPQPARPAAPPPPVVPVHPNVRPPLTPVFPNIATLSGPLPGGLHPPLANPPRDLFSVGRRRFPGSSFYPGIAYGYAPVDSSALNRPADNLPPAAQPAPGMLRLQVTPGSAQVFVDGLYAGTADDIENRRGLVVTPGPHRIELRARGYVADSVDVQIVPNDTVTYRAALDLERVAPPAATPASTTIYVIPGCYMGNVPPRRDRVAPGCDVRQARILESPQAAGSRARPVR